MCLNGDINMVTIKDAQIWKVGNSYVITIPMQYVKDEALELTKKYEVTIHEVGNLDENRIHDKEADTHAASTDSEL